MDVGATPLLPGAALDAFALRRFELAPATSVSHEPGLWRDALVVVERGRLDVEWACGRVSPFPAGSVLWLAGLPVRRLHNRAPDPAVLIAVARRRYLTPRGAARPDLLSFYRSQSVYTDPGEHADWLADLPRDIAVLRTIAAELVFHYRAHGDVTTHGFERARLGEIDLRYADLLLGRLRELQGGPVTAPRAPTERVLGCCRDHAVLLVSLARHVGVPARVRVGFAAYLLPGWCLDHVVAEVWDDADQRWRLVEAEVPEGFVDHGVGKGRVLDVLDVPRDRFLVGARAWRLAREGLADPDRFVVAPDVEVPFLRGPTYLAHNLVFDLAALNRHELLLWDSWSMLRDPSPPDEVRAARLDVLAERLEAPDLSVAELQELFSAEDVQVPEVVVTESPPVATATRLRVG